MLSCCVKSVCWILIALALIRAASVESTIICISKEKHSNCSRTFLDVDSALDFVGNTTNDVTVVLSPGKYNLSSNIQFEFIANLTILGETSNTLTAEIECQGNAGISFRLSNYISLQNINFFGCGARHNIGDNTIVQVAIYFQQCSYVTLHHVHMLDGIGVGVVFYACNGSNVIHSSVFHNNQPPNTDSFHSGGIHIGYPYCFLDEESNDCSSLVPKESASLSFYNISYCNFTKNSAGNYSDMEYVYSLPEKMSYYSDGCGGGLLVYFMGNDTVNNTVLVDRCVFEGNEGIYGGGALVSVGDSSRNNTVEFINTIFANNTASVDGGGVKIDFYVTNCENVNNNISFSNCLFENNNATTGGGLLMHGAKNPDPAMPRNLLLFNECLWQGNTAILGAALGFSLLHPLDSGSEPKITFTDCQFIKNNAGNYIGFGQAAGMATIYVHSVSLHFFSTVYFSSNIGTGISAVNSKIEFMSGCNSTFEYNTGITGGVFCLIATSYIKVKPGTVFYFTGNRASHIGNVLYGLLPSQHDTISSNSLIRNCYVQYSDSTISPNEWDAQFYFTNNTDSQHNNSIVVTSLLPCIWGKASNNITHLLDEVFCWNKTWHYSNHNCKGQVRSLVSHFTMPNGEELSARAGEVKFMNITAYDEQNENVTQSLVLTTDTGHDQGIQVVDTYHYISDNKIQFKQCNPTVNKVTVNIQTLFPRILQGKVEVTVDPCPLAYELNETSGFCECESYHNIILCEGGLSAKIRRSYWIGNYNTSQNDVINVAGYCSSCSDEDTVVGDYVAIPSSNSSSPHYKCPEHTIGDLCSRCENGYALSIHHHHCVLCPESVSSYIWIMYFLYTFVPITILFYILFFTNFSLASRHLNAAILFSQMISHTMDVAQNDFIPIDTLFKSSNCTEVLLGIQEVLYGIWNLQFCSPCLVEFCLSSSITHENPLLAVKYIQEFFPLLFVAGIFTYRRLSNMNNTCMVKVKNFFILFRPFNVCFDRFSKQLDFNASRSLRNVIASCVILAYTGCVTITMKLLSFSYLRNRTGDIEVLVPAYDQSTEYLHEGHVYYFALAILVSVVFLIPVPVILIFLRYNENAVAGRVSESYLNIFLEVFQRPFRYKSHVQPSSYTDDNEDNSIVLSRWQKQSFWRKHNCGSLHDYRWVPGAYFLLRASLVLAGLLPVMLRLLTQQLLCLIMVLVFLLFQPYKVNWNNKLDGFILSLMIIINGVTIYQYFLTVTKQSLSKEAFFFQYFLSYIPFLWIAAYILTKIFHAFKRVRNRSVTGVTSNELHAEAADDNSQYDTSVQEHLKHDQQQHVKDVLGLPTTNQYVVAKELPPEQVPLLEGNEDD